MQRAIGVSYDWTTATLYRETVLRMQTPLIEMMNRIPRARLGLKRRTIPAAPIVGPAAGAPVGPFMSEPNTSAGSDVIPLVRISNRSAS